mgnify:CR=1 FL=1|jgi:hypothetical protein
MKDTDQATRLCKKQKKSRPLQERLNTARFTNYFTDSNASVTLSAASFNVPATKNFIPEFSNI